jgi:hypothetical protein
MERIESLKKNGNSFFQSGEYEKASNLYFEAIQLFSKHLKHDEGSLYSNLLSNRAACFLKLGKYEACIEDCTYAIESNGSNLKALYRRASAFEKLGNLKSCKADLQMLLNLDPSNSEAIKLMRSVAASIQKSVTTSDVEKILSSFRSDVSGNSSVHMIRSLLDLCKDDVGHSIQFGKSGGLHDLVNIFSSPKSSDELVSSSLKLLACLTGHESFSKQFVEIINDNNLVDEKRSFLDLQVNCLSTGKLSFASICSLIKLQVKDVKRVVVMTVMNIVRSLPILREVKRPEEVTEDEIEVAQLFLGKSTVQMIFKLMEFAMLSSNDESFQFYSEAFCAFISDSPGYYDMIKQVDQRFESLEERKKRLSESRCLALRAKAHSEWTIQAGCFNFFYTMLDSERSSVRHNSASAIGKIIKSFCDEEKFKFYIEPLLSRSTAGLDTSNQIIELSDELQEAIPYWRKRATLEACLLMTHPVLGAWALQTNDGIAQIINLIHIGDTRCIEIAVEVICLAAGNESAVTLLKPIVEANLLQSLLHTSNPGIRSSAASALAKLAIKSKALNKDSPENSLILSTIQSVLKTSLTESNKTLTVADDRNSAATTMSSADRCIEVLASLVGKTYIKEEIVHGSSRYCYCCFTYQSQTNQFVLFSQGEVMY